MIAYQRTHFQRLLLLVPQSAQVVACPEKGRFYLLPNGGWGNKVREALLPIAGQVEAVGEVAPVGIAFEVERQIGVVAAEVGFALLADV